MPNAKFYLPSAMCLIRSVRKLFLWLILPLIFSFNCVVADDEVGQGRTQYLRAQKLKEFFAPDIPVEESALSLPEKPISKNFTEYEISGSSSLKYFVDASSLSIGDDGVIRMALGVKSTSGVWSLTYEGFRCDSYEFRIYGTSRGFDHEWRKNRRSKWIVAKNSKVVNMRFDLVRYYLCNGGSANRLFEISRRLEEGRLKIKTDRPT